MEFNDIQKESNRLNKKILIIDVKSSLIPSNEKFGIIEVCTLLFKPNQESPLLLTSLINPEVEISSESSKITGITNSLVLSSPKWKGAASYKIENLK